MQTKKRSFQIVLWLFCVLFFVYQYGIRSAVPNVLNEDLRQHFSIHTTEMGSLISLFYLAYTLMQIPVGLIADRFSAAKISIFAFASISISTIIFVATNNYFIAAIAQLCLGIGCSFAFVLIIKITNNVFSKKKVAFFSSLAISCGNLGPVIMGPLLAYLSQIFYWRNVVIGFGCCGFIFSVLGCLLLPNSEGGVITQKAEPDAVLSSIRKALTEPQYFCIGLYSMLVLGPVSAFCDMWGLTFIKNAYGIDKVQAASIVGAVYVGTIVGGPIIAYIAEKLNSYKRVMLYGSAMVFTLFSTVVFIHLNVYMLYVLLFVFGVVSTCQFLSFPAALSISTKNLEGVLTGVLNTITMLGGTVLVPLVGWSMDYFNANGTYDISDYKHGMTILLGAMLLSVITACCMRDIKVAEVSQA